MQDLTLALIQAELVWEDTPANLAKCDKMIGAIQEPVDLIILPEMFNTGFSINPEPISQKYMGPVFEWMQQKAKQTGAALTGSVLTHVEGKYYNRLYWVYPDGAHQFYDKKHLFRLGKEWQVFSPGQTKTIVEWKGWRILPLICYDLRFPVWSKNRLISGQHEYDLLIYVANWPVVRKFAWKTLLVARAMENLCYVAGTNRVGKDGSGMNHSGDSLVTDMKGQILKQANAYKAQTLITTIYGIELVKFREQFPFSLDWDDFEIRQ
jgi:omega-amidase